MTCSPGGGFIGSDNPVTLDGLKGKEIGFKNADIIAYPVSKHVVLYSTLNLRHRPSRTGRTRPG